MLKQKAKTFFDISKFDMFGLKFNFNFNGKEVFKTRTGAFLTLLYGIIIIGLFFFFALDLIQRLNPRVSFDSSKATPEYIPVSNDNMSYAFRVENQNGSMVIDDTLIYFNAFHFNYVIENGGWVLKKETTLAIEKCNKLRNIKDKESYYGVSLESWYCINFDGLNMGGNWDGKFVNGIQINAMQCINSTAGGKVCSSEEVIEKNFRSTVTSSNLFFSDMALDLQPMMNNYTNPLGSLLVNRYEMFNLQYTKRKVQTYKMTTINNDIGWFFPDVLKESIVTLDTSLPDFTFKDKWTQPVLYTSFIYLGNKSDTYIRSYAKIQEVLAAIGGFAKFFHVLITLVYLYIGNIYKNLALTESYPFNEDYFGMKREEPNTKNINSGLVSNSKTISQLNNFFYKGSPIKREKLSLRVSDYLCNNICRNRHLDKIKRDMINKYEAYHLHYTKKFDVIEYIKLHKDIKVLKSVLLNEENQLLLKLIRPELRFKDNEDINKYLKNTEQLSKSSRVLEAFKKEDIIGGDYKTRKLLAMLDKIDQNAIKGK